jgi:hypothetical protein
LRTLPTIAGLTGPLWFRTRLAVAVEQPARSATWRSVAIDRFPAFSD